MARNYSTPTILALLFSVCSVGWAFQSAETLVSIVPRSRPMPADAVPNFPEPNLRVAASLVQIPVHVTTASGSSVTTLREDNFRLFEDGIEQKISHFALDDAPVSIGLLFDVSGSMQNKMRQAIEASAAFFKTANAEDEFFLIEFSERPKLVVPLTSDSDEVYQRIVHARPFGRTALLDAIHMAMNQMKSARNLRKAIVILSDGGDNRSRYTEREIKNALLESDVQVYAMGIFDREEQRKRTPEEQNGPKLLDYLAEQTGGHSYPVDNLEELPVISARIGNELRNQYLLGYTPSNEERDGKYRRVKVSLTAPDGMVNLRTYYRLGYHSPTQ